LSAKEENELYERLHLMLAVITPFETPEPSVRTACAPESKEGSLCPDPDRGESVTLSPALFVYMTNMVEPDIPLPEPIPIQLKLVGPEIWM
jgi:hypothetical protein